MQILREDIVRASLLRPGAFVQRQTIDAAALDELSASIRAIGVIYPIIVREQSNQTDLEIIAGERRWRASQLITPDFLVPVRLVDATDEEAEQLALTENSHRADPTPMEEGVSAERYLNRLNGNRDEAARSLGWPINKLNRRLALMRCIPDVRKALTNQTILLGHAELLAVLPDDKQSIALARILEHKLSVSQVKSKLADLTQKLDSAIFNKEDCIGCRFNSADQSSLFSESLGEGHCTNAPCFLGKTEAAVEAKRTMLLEQVHTVRILRPNDSVVSIKLIDTGATGVGQAQAKACRACADFGSTISLVPGHIGEVQSDQCMNLTCNAKMVAKRLQAERAHSDNQTKPTATSSASKVSKSRFVPPAKPSAISERIKAYRVAQWRRVCAEVIAHSSLLGAHVLIALGLGGFSRCIAQHVFNADFTRITGSTEDIGLGVDLDQVMSVVCKTDIGNTGKLIAALAASAITDLPEEHLVELMAHLKIDLGQHWKLNADFCNLLTTAELGVVAEEVGLKTALGDRAQKLFKGTKANLVTSLLTVEGFSYAGVVPNVMHYTGDLKIL